jgi:hypothetical protein
VKVILVICIYLFSDFKQRRLESQPSFQANAILAR